MKTSRGRCLLSTGHFSLESQNPTVFTLNVKTSFFGKKYYSFTKKYGNRNLRSSQCFAFYHKMSSFLQRLF